MFFDPKDNPQGMASPSPAGSMSLDQICNALESMIEKADGDKKDKLQQAYDLVEEIKGEKSDASEDGKEEGTDDSNEDENEEQRPTLNTDLTMGPMGKLKNYLAKASVDHQSQM